ncbi:MAG: hypothetical protein R8G66_01170 [Cytophagales bacterium]|nr:hypothetical protein [Cytophagales bacterium]
MTNFNDLTSEQLTYLKQKWSAEAHELNREIVRTTTRLNTRVNRQEVNQQELAALTDDLSNAQGLLDHLTTTSAPTEMIDNQQALVDRLQGELDTANSAGSGLTATEAVLQQAGIDELELQKQYREDKIGEIDAILSTDAAA